MPLLRWKMAAGGFLYLPLSKTQTGTIVGGYLLVALTFFGFTGTV